MKTNWFNFVLDIQRLTNKQILLLGQFFSEIIICFDGDEGGYKAALRAAENSLRFLQPEKQISFLFLPNGEDPDSFLKDKDKKCTIALESLEEDFLKFWDLIGAKGDQKKALLALNERHNASRLSNSDFTYKVKLFLLGFKNFILSNIKRV